MIATNDDAYLKLSGKTSRERTRLYTKEDIRQIVESGNAIQKAALSEYFFATNGLYKRIIIHYATFLTYSWILVPYPKKGEIDDKKNSATYDKAADFCSTFQIEAKCSLFAKDILVKGAYYGLLRDEDGNVVIQDLPFDYCRSSFKNAQDVDLVEFDVSFFDQIRNSERRELILETYPKYIVKAYKKYKHSHGPKWIFLPAGKGIYFCYFEERPFFLDLIPLLDDLDDYKDVDKERNIQALKKILVQKMPIDGTKLVFEPDEAEVMHKGALQMVKTNRDLDVLTSYADVSLLDLSSDDDSKTEVSDVQDLIYSSAGLSKELFFATTEAGLNYSVNNDLAMVMILGARFSHFFTTILNYKFENNRVKFKLIILPLSYYNSADYTSRAKELAAFGYSFLTPILSTGLDQTNLAALKALENDLLDLDEILKPLQSSYTQSGKAQGEPIGDIKKSSDTKKETDDDGNDSDKEDDKTKEKRGDKDAE